MSYFNNQFSSTLAGNVPASGGGTTNFLRADGSWVAAGGSVTLTDDTTTSATYYPVFATASSGALTAKTSSTKLKYDPATGIFTADQFVAAGTGSAGSFATSVLYAFDTQSSWLQLNIQNQSNNAAASSDLVATADTGTDTVNYIDFGINGSAYSVGTWTVNGALDGYIYTQSSNIALGTAASGKNVVIFTGGTLAANVRLTISDTVITPAVPISVPASQGITIASGAPSTTTNALYSVTGNLYYNGTQLVAGSGTTVNSGTATLDFGSGEYDNTVVVTGIATISTTSKVVVRVKAVATSNHTLEEAYIENLEIYAGNIVNSTGFTIYGKSTSGLIIGQFTIEYSWYN